MISSTVMSTPMVLNTLYKVEIFQFAKSQEFLNVRTLQIFERKVFLTVLNSRKIFERDILSSDSVAKCATQKP